MIKRASAVALLTILVRLPTLWEPRWYSDEGTFTTVAWVHSLGGPLYSGVFDINPPGIYWLYGVLLRAGADQHHFVVQAALLIAVLVSALCIFWIASPWFGPNVGMGAAVLAAAGLSLPTLDGDLLNIEIAALPFFLAALLMSLKKGTLPAVLAGMLAGCALLIRPSFVLDSLAILVVLSAGFTSARRVILALLGAVLVVGAAVIALASGNALGPYVSQAMPLQRAYVMWANGGSFSPLILRLAIALAVAVLWYRRAHGANWRPLAVWLPASVAASSITPRELSHYAVEVIPPLAIAIAALIAFGLGRVDGHRRLPRLAATTLGAALGLGLLVTAAEAVLVLPPREVALMRGTSPPPPFLHNFSYGALPGYYGRWASSVVQHPFRAEAIDGFPGPFAEEAKEAQQLDRLTAGSRPTLQVLGDRAWVYVLSRLRPATPYIAMNSAFRLDPSASSRVAESITSREADFVAVADVPRAEWLGKLEAAHYEPVPTAPWPTYRAPF
jgi:hypothetical protein